MLKSCWIACLFTTAATAFVVEKRDAPSNTTLLNYARYCQSDGSSCLYTFGIEEQGTCQSSPCVFTVDAKDGKPAGQTGFQAVECQNMKQFSYRVNGGWDPSGFTTIVVTNVDHNTATYFSFKDDEQMNGKIIDARTQTTYQIKAADEAAQLVGSRDLEDNTDDVQWWQLQDMVRTFDTGMGIVQLDFDIAFSNGTKHSCELLLQSPDEPKDVNSWSFYNQDCAPHDFYISWGYNKDDDFAVMTLCSPDRSQRAFFGYSHVSRQSRLGDTTKSAVQDVAC